MRRISLCLVALAAFALSACGADNEGSSSVQNPVPAPVLVTPPVTSSPSSVPETGTEDVNTPVQDFELDGIGYTDHILTSDGREERSNPTAVGVPVLILKDRKVVGARSTDRVYGCDIKFDQYRLSPASASMAFMGVESKLPELKVGVPATIDYSMYGVKVGTLTCMRSK